MIFLPWKFQRREILENLFEFYVLRLLWWYFWIHILCITKEADSCRARDAQHKSRFSLGMCSMLINSRILWESVFRSHCLLSWAPVSHGAADNPHLFSAAYDVSAAGRVKSCVSGRVEFGCPINSPARYSSRVLLCVCRGDGCGGMARRWFSRAGGRAGGRRPRPAPALRPPRAYIQIMWVWRACDDD